MTPNRRHTFRRIGILLLLGGLSGCAHLYDPVDEMVLVVRSCVNSKVSWRQHHQLYQDVCFPYHFGKGFRAGYNSVCLGGGGCPPTLPPREYWSVCHQSEVGRAQSVEWFNGFAEGALAAQMDGRDLESEIVTSREATGQNGPLETEYHINSQQMTPYGTDMSPQNGYPQIGAPDADWQGLPPTLDPPPSPTLAPDDFLLPGVEHDPLFHGQESREMHEEHRELPVPPLPLPPLDEHQIPEVKEAPIPNIDFHVESRPDGRPWRLVPTNFLSPEDEAGEQLGSRINALWRKVF